MKDATWRHWLDTLYHNGDRVESRNGGSLELLGTTMTIGADEPHYLLPNPVRDASLRYAVGELFWYLTGSNRLDHIAAYAPSYGRFSDDGETLNGAYGPEIDRSIEEVFQEIEIRPTTRRAQIVLGRSVDHDTFKTLDFPCTTSLQFIPREGRLHVMVTMRSNDVWLGMPYDVFCFRSIQLIVAGCLKLRMGDYHHHVGSLHLYDRNRASALEALEAKYTSPAGEFRVIPMDRFGWRNNINFARAVEEKIRRGDAITPGTWCVLEPAFEQFLRYVR